MKNIAQILKSLFFNNAALLKNFKSPALTMLLLVTSCDNFVDVDLPASQLTSGAVFEDESTANAAMAALFSKLRNNGILAGNSTGMSSCLGLYTDEFDYYQQNSVSTFYNNVLVAGDSQISDIWNKSYNQIYIANSIIEGLKNSVNIKPADKNQLLGEAIFIRALIHFTLTNLYDDIPYIPSTDYLQNSKVYKSTTDQIYAYCINDLNEAVELLSENYFSSERIRPNQSAAKALLARVYLYIHLYPEASNAASAVINNPLYKNEDDLDKIFLKASTTTIWQFTPSVAGKNTDEGELYIFTSGPPPIVGLRPDFISAFEQGDKRKAQWTTEVVNGTDKWYYASKYKEHLSTGVSMEYSVIFRLAEQYLIRAESRVYQSDLVGAKEDLNVIRNTAGLQNTTAVSAEDIIADIMKQRRFELFTEFGQRFFDLKRTGKLDETLSASKPGWNTSDRLWPIPALELSSNPNLKPQNEGY